MSCRLRKRGSTLRLDSYIDQGLQTHLEFPGPPPDFPVCCFSTELRFTTAVDTFQLHRSFLFSCALLLRSCFSEFHNSVTIKASSMRASPFLKHSQSVTLTIVTKLPSEKGENGTDIRKSYLSLFSKWTEESSRRNSKVQSETSKGQECIIQIGSSEFTRST
jgi:hypothetical protein